jgi:phage shock protein PspC (stress-responsive transcriptional regulator)
MNTNTMNPEATTYDAGQYGSGPNDCGQDTQPPFRTAPRTALRRSRQDRMVSGVAAGVARYLGVDVTMVRIAFAVLIVFTGAGVPLYLAGLLLIPEEGREMSIAGSLIENWRARQTARS